MTNNRSKCKTGKKQFRDEIAAKLAMAVTVHSDRSTRNTAEKRAYSCNFCRKWHLTSQPKRSLS